MEKIYYSPKGFWKGHTAIKKLSKEAKVSEKQAFEFLRKQAIWQIYLPAPKKIIRPKFDVSAKDEVHQADLLFLPYDTFKVGRTNKTYKYTVSLVDVGTRYKEAEPLTSKDSKEVAKAFKKIFSRHLKYPKLLQVDPGREFMGVVTQLMDKHNVRIRRGRTEIHRDQGVVERFNRTLAERLFGYQYAKELGQSVTRLATDACLTTDPGVASLIPARYHTFVEIDHEIISTVILLPSADLFKTGCQLQAKVCAQITG